MKFCTLLIIKALDLRNRDWLRLRLNADCPNKMQMLTRLTAYCHTAVSSVVPCSRQYVLLRSSARFLDSQAAHNRYLRIFTVCSRQLIASSPWAASFLPLVHIVNNTTHSLSECGFEIPKTYRAPAHIWDLPRWWKLLLLMYKIFDRRTFGISHQIKGPTTVKVAKTG